LPDRWLLLGGGNGLRITWTEDSVPPAERPPTVTVEPSPDRVRDDTWAQP
jgi:hypothetical protein